MHVNRSDINFNPSPSTIIHIDLNSCFATIEQQANPFLRGKPIAIAAYNSPGGCILAPSIEAKTYGIKTGMRVSEGKKLCPQLLIKDSDPNKYRNVHLALRKILGFYTNDFYPKSIDEFVLNMEGFPVLEKMTMHEIGGEIKKRIKMEIGEWITVSIGISTNRSLAKLASNIRKPDGLDEINHKNFLNVYRTLKLTDLSGINIRNAIRLSSVGIRNIVDFYKADLLTLRAAFRSVLSYYWYMRLRGWEVDDFENSRRSYGNSYAIPEKLRTPEELSPILAKLTEKMCFRLRRAGFVSQGVHLSLTYKGGGSWHKGVKTEKILFDSRDFYRKAYYLLTLSPSKQPVHTLFISCFNLTKLDSIQMELFSDIPKKLQLTKAVDEINEHWGGFVIHSGRMANTGSSVHDRIAFGGVKELEEIIL